MENNHKRFGTFDGVFTPTILTIIGVILYLRLGWVIGNTGLIGALLIIVEQVIENNPKQVNDYK